MKKGFSQIEVLIVIALLVILFSLGTVVYDNFVKKDRLIIEARKIESLISEARVKTVAGFSLGGSQALNFGVYFEDDQYTLFPGTVYSSGNSQNQVFVLPDSVRIDEIFLPADSIVFEKITGEILGFDPVNNYLMIADQQSSMREKISVNQLGVVLIEEQ
ncbi:Tfp pilus assembly protein FimT/FimU [Patescibacteria group bacterium]